MAVIIQYSVVDEMIVLRLDGEIREATEILPYQGGGSGDPAISGGAMRRFFLFPPLLATSSTPEPSAKSVVYHFIKCQIQRMGPHHYIHKRNAQTRARLALLPEVLSMF